MVSEKEQVDIIRRQIEGGAIPFVLAPERWADCKLPVQLDWSPMHFGDSSQSHTLPEAGGVYSFILKPALIGPPETAYLLYIGKTKEIRRRYREYIFYKSPSGYKTRPHIHDMLNKWPDEIWFFFAQLEDIGLQKTVEDMLLNSCVPPFNINFEGRVNTAVRLWRNLGPIR